MIENRVSILNDGTSSKRLSFFKSMIGRKVLSGLGTTVKSLIYDASYDRDSFWNFVWEKVKTLILEFFCSQCEIRSPPNIGVFTVSDNRWSCGRSIFQGNPAIKTSKMILLDHNIVDIGTLTDTKSNWYEDIWRWHRIFGSVYMPSIRDPWPVAEVNKFFF